MKTNIFFTLLALSISSLLFAQRNKDALYLKNGNIYRGTIISPVDTNRIGIELKDRSVLYFDKSEVEATNSNETVAKPKGFVLKVNNSIYGGSRISSAIRIQGGYKIKNKLYFGVGSGLEGFGNRYIPIFAEVNYMLSKSSTQPFIYGYGGYNFYAGNGNGTVYYYDEFGYYNPAEYKGGALAGAGLGINKHITSGFALGFQIGYRFQYTSYTYTNYYWNANWEYVANGTTTVSDYMNRVELGLHMTF